MEKENACAPTTTSTSKPTAKIKDMDNLNALPPPPPPQQPASASTFPNNSSTTTDPIQKSVPPLIPHSSSASSTSSTASSSIPVPSIQQNQEQQQQSIRESQQHMFPNPAQHNHASSKPLVDGDTISGPANRYKLIKTIGSGSFSKVKLAVEVATNKQVAVKLIDKKMLKGSESLRLSLGREVEVMKLLAGHEGVVQLIEVIDTPSQVCLVLEYVSGGELFDFIADHFDDLTESECKRLFKHFMESIVFMHGKQICHRDLKLENILISSPDSDIRSLKLADFGLARTFTPGQKLTTRCGSEEYAAPEIILGNHYDGTHTDMWAIGCILFAMLCGQLPFEIDDMSANPQKRGRKAMLWRIVKGEFHWPDFVEVKISQEAKDLVTGMLQAKPEKRLTAEQVLQHDWLNR